LVRCPFLHALTFSLFENDSVSLGDLQAKIEELEDFIQSVEVEDMREEQEPKDYVAEQQ
jgi:hypothetical protein